jgi:hypothetical protein
MFPWRRWRLILAHLAIVAACVAMLTRARSASSGGATGDFPLFLQAARSLVAGEPLHAPDRGYIYGPFPALLFAGLLPLGTAGAAWALAALNAAAYWTCLLAGARGAARAFGGPLDRLIIGEVAAIALLLSMDKARLVISGGQTDFLVLLPVVLALVWNRTRPLACGALLGFAANVKYVSIVFLPYLLARRQWRAAAAMTASTLLCAVAPALVCGWKRNLQHWDAALGGMGHLLGLETPSAARTGDITFEFSISVTSAVARHAGSLGLVVTILLALGVFAAALALYRRNGIPLLLRPAPTPADECLTWLEWGGLIVAVLAFGPQTQGRHFVMLLPLYLAAAAMLRHPKAPRWPVLLGLLALQLGLLLPPGGAARFERAVQVWRGIGGASWCLIVMYLCTLAAGLKTARALTSGGTASPGPGS